jgi:hypothetical protein
MLRIALVLSLLASSSVWAAEPEGIRFEVKFSPAVAPKAPITGRLVLAIAPTGQRPSFTSVDPPARPVLGIDVKNATADSVLTLDAKSMSFPADALKQLPAGTYDLQASLMVNADLFGPQMPNNYFAQSRQVKLDPKATTPVKLVLETVFSESKPPETATFKYHLIESPLLSKFHGRPQSLRVGVCLPKDFKADGAESYGLVIWIGGFGQRASSARGLTPDSRFVQIMVDGAGPFGDPYSVNSANNGPHGDALIQEVLPFLAKTYRAGLEPKSRFLTGTSTGGWVSMALQVFYPDQFNGCWSQAPDGLDFRAFQLINIYRDDNAYVNRYGFERPAKRTLQGDVEYTVRHECQLERVLGFGDRWELGGQQWASWNAVYGPRGADGKPVPLWDGATGKINPAVAKEWEKYDLAKILNRDWKTLGPKLTDKLNIWVGESDDYFLNNGVHYLKEILDRKSEPKFQGQIEIAIRRGHTAGWSTRQVLDAMAKRMK